MTKVRFLSLVVSLVVSVVVSFVLAPVQAAWAGAFEDATHCNRADEQLAMAKRALADDQRLVLMDTLYNEIAALESRSASEVSMPPQFYQRCKKNKAEAFNANAINASEGFKARFEFNLTMGHLKVLLRQEALAYQYLSKAAKLKPNDYNLHWEVYNLWVSFQTRELRASHARFGDRQKLNEFLKVSKELLENVLQVTTAPSPLKVLALTAHADLLEALARLDEAMETWQRVLSWEPRNVTALQRLATLEIKNGRPDRGRKILETLSPVVPQKAEVQRTLVRLQVEDEDYMSAINTLKIALPHHPEDAELLALQASAQAESGDVARARDTLKKLQIVAPRRPSTLRALAKLLRVQGEQAIATGSPGKAMAMYEKALNLSPDDKKLRAKMALLIFDHHKASLAPARGPASVTGAMRKDMDRASQLLEPLFAKAVSDTRLADVFVASSARSSKPLAAAPLCDRYETEYGTPQSVGVVLDCASIYQSMRNLKRARQILSAALGEKRFAADRPQLEKALRASGG